MGALGMGLGLAFGQKGGNPPPPASVASPVVGTSLTSVWNLQYSGTGTNAAFSNGTWSTVTPGAGGSTTNLPTYLINQGVVWNNYSELWIDVGTSTKTISNYDFSNAPPLSFNGTGAGNITFTNCRFAGIDPYINGLVYFPADINRNLNTSDLTPMTVTFNNCTFSVAVSGQACGYVSYNYCRFTGQKQNIGDVAYLGTGLATRLYNQCYITGGGVQPAPAAHMELTQFVRNVAGCSLTLTNNMIDISKDGQTTTAPWGSGWTGQFAVNANGGSNGPTVTMTNNIFIGAAAVDANPANPNVTNCILAYGNGMVATLTNNVMEAGHNGYVSNQDGVPVYEAADGGGNRSYTNTALTTASGGWN